MKITVKHSSIVIDGYNRGDSEKLEKIFSVYNKTYHAYFPKGIEFRDEEQQLILPRGIDIYYIEQLFKTTAIVETNCDTYDKICDVKMKYLPRDDKQKEALKFMIGKDQYYHTYARSQLCVNLPTGAGKTYCSIATMMYYGIRSIVIASSIGWLEQWKKCIVEYTNIKPKEIIILSGSPTIKKILRSDMSQYKVILASDSTIKSYGEREGWDKVTELFRHMRVGLKFYDECHLHFDTMMKIDFYTNTYKSYYVSATPARSDREEDRIYQLCFKNVPSIELFNEDEDPHTKYISLMYNSHPSAIEKSSCRNQYGLNRIAYTEYVVHTPNFEKMLVYLINLAMKSDGKTLIYIGTNNAIKYVKSLIIHHYPELVNDVGIYTSIVTTNKQLELEKKIILSTTKSCGAAVDIKGLKNTIVLAEPFSSNVIAKQTLGRTRDDDTFYIEVVDLGFNQIYKYYYQKKAVFNKYALSCQEVSMKDNILDSKYNEIKSLRMPPMVNPFIQIQSNSERLYPDKLIQPFYYI